jgi:SulP family sulfate permease
MFEKRKIPKGVEIYEVTEPFSFGALHRYWTTIRGIGGSPRGIILVLRKVHFLDQSDFHLLKGFCERCYREKVKIVLVGAQAQPLSLVKKEGLYDSIGPQNIVNKVSHALSHF